MPSPKNVRKDSSKKTPEKTETKAVDLGQKLSVKRSQDFKSKIELWDVTGADAEQKQPKDAVGPSKESNTKAIVTKPSDANGIPGAIEGLARKVSREVDPERKAWVRRRSRTQPSPAQAKADATPEAKAKASPKPHPKPLLDSKDKTPQKANGNDENADVAKRPATPKRRVVSDEHWLKDRTKPKENGDAQKAKEKEKDITPKPVVVRRSVASVGLKVPPSVQDFRDVPEPSRALRRQLQQRDRSPPTPRERDVDRAASPDYESSGTKVFIKRRRKSKPSAEQVKGRAVFNTSESSITEPSSVDTDVTTPEVTPERNQVHRSRTDPNLKARGRLVSPEPTQEPPAHRLRGNADDTPRRPGRTRPDKTRREESRDTVPNTIGVPDRPPKLPTEQPVPTAPGVYGSRIEGWLAAMPDDPFTDSQESLLAPTKIEVSHMALKQHDSDPRIKDDMSRKRSGTRRYGVENNPDEPDEYELLATSRSSRRDGNRRSRGAPPTRDKDFSQTREMGRAASAEPEIHSSQRDLRDDRYRSGAAKRLSTIASVSTLRDQRPGTFEESVLSRVSDGDEPVRYGTVLRNRRTKHSDLMSVLSLPREDARALAPARSIRTKRRRHSLMNAEDLMNEVTTDELKYQRELRTLVDGVIPVLLQYVLSQDDKQPSRRGLKKGDPALTQPIVEMGVALERLRASHKRIPMHAPSELLVWAEHTSNIYSAYVNAWRLGFNDVVVNLAPAEKKREDPSASWDDGLQRNEHGDLLDGDGERVDVAYLLKRPLVRIKDLSKTLKAINQIRPSMLSENVLGTYDSLVAKAKQRTNDERARLEDEAAAAIDPSRARDPCSLAPLSGVSIDPARRVRARDFFTLEFFHSSGQQLDCKIEVIFRDDPTERGPLSGDILICEISPAGRWLLFPPVALSSVSSRQGDKDGETVIMIRGRGSDGVEWRELLSLHSDEEQRAEWIEMLGSDPLPPRLTRRSSFNMMRSPRVQFASLSASSGSDLPIGEQARSSATKWDGSEVNSVSDVMSRPNLPGSRHSMLQSAPSTPPHRDVTSGRRDGLENEQVRSGQRGPSEPSPVAGRRHARSASEWIPRGEPGAKKGYGDLPTSWDRRVSEESVADETERPQRRPTLERRTSSVPSMDLPTVHKLRKVSRPEPPPQSSNSKDPPTTPLATAKEPTSAPAKLQKRPPVQSERNAEEEHATPARGGGLSSIPSFTPAFLQKRRRSSSPLKHEYEPSTATESSESDGSDMEDNESVTSESSAEEAISTLGELRDFSKSVPMRSHSQIRPLEPQQSTDADTIRPSESASLAPYRTIPPQAHTSTKSVACIFSWSDSGSWDNMHPEECQIVVTPGLIEAFDLAQANAVSSNPGAPDEPSPSTRGVKPLVALELTPWVPLRRGTAVDISIRSPPTVNSVLRKGNNIMFRSHSPEECEKLYNLINRARIDNPTWMALQNARGPAQTSNWGEVMERRNATRTNGNASWLKTLSRKGSTYRSKGTRSASVAGSQSSVGTINSAFSAIRQFSGGSKIFNIAKSTIMSKTGTRSSQSDSLSSAGAAPSPIDTSMGTPVGITNSKIRLYVRETTTKWRDLGNARLTVMLPPRRDPSVPADPRITGVEKRILIFAKHDSVILDVTLGESCFERVARTGIAISVWEEGVGPNGEVGYTMATGGVSSSHSTVYMVQMKSEREAAYTFSMVGKLRY